MATILRGDIRWANLAPTKGSEQAGRRPVVILSEDTFNERSGTVIAMAITSQQPKVGFPLALELTTPRLAEKILGKNQSNSNSLCCALGNKARSRQRRRAQ